MNIKVLLFTGILSLQVAVIANGAEPEQPIHTELAAPAAVDESKFKPLLPSNETVQIETVKVVKVKKPNVFKRIASGVKGQIHSCAYAISQYTK